MQTAASRRFVALRCSGHTFVVFFDDTSRAQLLDYLLDLASDPATPVTWQCVFAVIDALAAPRPRPFARAGLMR